MDFEEISFTEIRDLGDERGSSFSAPDRARQLIGLMGDAHITTLRPGHVRGNHFHIERDEVIFVYATDSWTFCWDTGENTRVDQRELGRGCVLVELVRGWSHAVVNSGQEDLVIIALTTGLFDPRRPDAHRRTVTR